MFNAFVDIDDDDDDDDKAGKVLQTRTNDNNKNKNNENNNDDEQREAEPPFLLHLNLPACITTAGLAMVFRTRKSKWGYTINNRWGSSEQCQVSNRETKHGFCDMRCAAFSGSIKLGAWVRVFQSCGSLPAPYHTYPIPRFIFSYSLY